MTNYRAFSALLVSGSAAAPSNAWGVMPVSGAVGSINLHGGGTISIVSLQAGQPFPCYVDSVIGVTGSVYILS